MKRILKWVLWLVFAIAVVMTFVYLWKQGQPKEKNYQEVSPSVGDSVVKKLTLSGTIKPRDEVSVKPQIAGIISKILVEPGQEVKVGDVIAHISVVPELQQVNSAESSVEQARISLHRMQEMYNRDKALYDKGLIAAEEFEKSSAEYANAKLQLSSAEQALQITKTGVSSKYGKQTSTLVRATISGRVLSVPVKVGTSVIQANTFNEGTTIATIADMNNMIFEGNADETEVGKLAIGQEMLLKIGAIPDMTLNATIEYISPQGTATSGVTNFQVRGALQGINAEQINKLRAGFGANAEIVIARVSNVMTIPEACLTYRGDSVFVQVADSKEPNKYTERSVSIGVSDGAKVEVKKGIAKGDKLRGTEVNGKE